MEYKIDQKIREESVIKINSVLNNIINSTRIENSIHNSTINYCNINFPPQHIIDNIYIDKLETLMNSLISENNEYFLPAVKNNEINLNDIGYLVPYELDPKRWKREIEKKKYNKEKTETIKTTDIYKCYKCKERKCTTYEIQTKSADESMTVYVTCQNCGNRWKIN